MKMLVPRCVIVLRVLIFNGPCPDVASELSDISDKIPLGLDLILITHVELRINHFYYKDTPYSETLRVTLEWNNHTFIVFKETVGEYLPLVLV